MKDKKKKFSWRAWTTFVATLSFIIDTVSGIILYIAPPGRIAHWTNWTIWGLDKEEWVAIHTIFGYLLLIIVAIHLYFNWNMFWNFIWSKVRKALNLRWEILTAILINLFVFLFTVWSIPPFSTVINLGENLKESWEESKVQVPIAHAELMSLEEFSLTIQIPPDQALSALKSKGYAVKNARQTLGEIAKENRTSPDKLYEAIKSGGLTPTIPETVKGSGIGRKTLDTICSEENIPLEQALSRLKQNGIDARPGDRLRDIATKYEKTPMEITNILKGEQQ